jgi:hypothetical protein
MPSAVIVETRPRRSVARPAIIALGVVAAVATFWLVLRIVEPPATVPRLVLVNPSPVDVEIDVSRAPGAGTLDLGHLSAGETRTIRDVIDQGNTWVVDFSSARGRLGAVEVGRAELARNDWTIHLPAALVDRAAR